MNQNAVNTFETEDIEKNKVVSALAYLGILFFLPLVACPQSRYGRFHANQALLLLIASVAGGIVSGILMAIIPVVGMLVNVVICLAVFILMVYGLVNTLQGNAKQLPVIGGLFTILK